MHVPYIQAYVMYLLPLFMLELYCFVRTHSRKVMDVARAVQRVVSKKNLLESYSDSPIPSDDREYLKSDDDADDEFDRASLKSICGSDEHSLSSSLECLVDEDEMPNLSQFGSVGQGVTFLFAQYPYAIEST